MHVLDDLIKNGLGPIEEEMRSRGWAFVRLSPSLSEAGQRLCAAVSRSPVAEAPRSSKRVFNSFVRADDGRVSLTAITSTFGTPDEADRESNFGLSKRVAELARELDALQSRLIDRCVAEGWFPDLGPANGVDVPLAVAPSRIEPQNRYALLDVVHYYPAARVADTEGRSSAAPATPAVVVAPHADPGLVTISVCSNAPGLELLDPRADPSPSSGDGPGAWERGPVSRGVRMGSITGVLWLGRAAERASRGAFSAAVHRVVDYGDWGDEGRSGGRVAVWHESCTSGTVPPDALAVEDKPAPRVRGGGGKGGGKKDAGKKNRAPILGMPDLSRSRDTNVAVESKSGNLAGPGFISTVFPGDFDPDADVDPSFRVVELPDGAFDLSDGAGGDTFRVEIHNQVRSWSSGASTTEPLVAVVAQSTPVTAVSELLRAKFGIPLSKIEPGLSCDGNLIDMWGSFFADDGEGTSMASISAGPGSKFVYG